MIIDQHEQGTPEWLAARAGVVTASCLSKVMAKGRGNALSKVRTEYMIQLATEIVTGNPVGETPVNYWMERGTELEPDARMMYEMLTDSEVVEAGLIYLDEDRRIGASVDGIVGNGLVEIKCPKLVTHVSYLLDDRLPPAYKAQVHGQMWIADKDHCDFVSYHPDSHKQIFMHRVERDDEYIETLKSAVSQFVTELDDLVDRLKAL
jgi:putative phage-type endonuclease